MKWGVCRGSTSHLKLTKLHPLVDEVALDPILVTMAERVSLAVKSKAQGQFLQRVAAATADVSAAELHGAKVLSILLERLADTELPVTVPLARARLRGILAMRQILHAEGGTFTVNQVKDLLGISRQAVDKRRKADQLLAVELPRRGLLYPVWQFAESGTLPGLIETLGVLRPHDSWARLRFFVTRNDRLAGRRPLDLLRKGDIERVLRAAEMFGEHGAA